MEGSGLGELLVPSFTLFLLLSQGTKVGDLEDTAISQCSRIWARSVPTQLGQGAVPKASLPASWVASSPHVFTRLASVSSCVLTPLLQVHWLGQVTATFETSLYSRPCVQSTFGYWGSFLFYLNARETQFLLLHQVPSRGSGCHWLFSRKETESIES